MSRFERWFHHVSKFCMSSPRRSARFNTNCLRYNAIATSTPNYLTLLSKDAVSRPFQKYLFLHHRDAERSDQAAAWTVLQYKFSPVRQGGLSNNCKTEAGASAFCISRTVGTVEGLPHP